VKITLTFNDGSRRRGRLPYPNAPRVVVNRKCGAKLPNPGLGKGFAGGICDSTEYKGAGMSIESRDTYRANAICDRCGHPAGTLRVQVPTMWGIEEDERVLNGPWKVY
jgi:hypothetical protein